MAEESLELQFERAELDRPDAGGAPPAPAVPATAGALARLPCADCGNHVRSYFSVNGRSVCRRCHDEAVARHRGLAPLALLKAAGLGLVASLLGAAIYFGVAKLTGYEIGLVAIVVGLLVGGAVRLGSGGRGGWRYQALAMALCYLAISMSYGAFVVAELAKRQEAAAAAPAAGPDGAVQPAALQGADGAAADQPAEDEEAEAPGGGVAAGQLLVLVLSLPFLIGFESPMAFVLLAIALWEAWKLNKAQPFEASGPFAVGGGEAAGAPAAPPAG